MLETIVPRWNGLCVVAAPGPSLTEEVAAAIAGRRTVAVQDAWRRLPVAEVLYGCDRAWWNCNRGCPEFAGEKWSSHDDGTNRKLDMAKRYGLRLIRGRDGIGFSTDPAVIHYGKNSGFQAINLAILFGATRIVLVGFDMRLVDGRRYFFGNHYTRAQYGHFIAEYDVAAACLPDGIEIINCTPNSALRCFDQRALEDAL